MFGSLGWQELLLIFGLALLIFGPRKLPEIGRTLGKGLAEFRRATTELKRSLNAEMIEQELRDSDPRKLLREEPPDDDERRTTPARRTPPGTTPREEPTIGGAVKEAAAEKPQ